MYHPVALLIHEMIMEKVSFEFTIIDNQMKIFKHNHIYMGRLGCVCMCVCVCVCVPNGRSNGLPDLDQDLGMDSHLPWG